MVSCFVDIAQKLSALQQVTKQVSDASPAVAAELIASFDVDLPLEKRTDNLINVDTQGMNYFRNK